MVNSTYFRLSDLLESRLVTSRATRIFIASFSASLLSFFNSFTARIKIKGLQWGYCQTYPQKIFIYSDTSTTEGLEWRRWEAAQLQKQNFKISVYVMRSEKPYTKFENVILRFSWHRIEERTRSILKKNLSKA